MFCLVSWPSLAPCPDEVHGGPHGGEPQAQPGRGPACPECELLIQGRPVEGQDEQAGAGPVEQVLWGHYQEISTTTGRHYRESVKYDSM